MVESSKAGSFGELSAIGETEELRWSPPQTAMFVTVTSAGLWALIFAAGRWLLA